MLAFVMNIIRLSQDYINSLIVTLDYFSPNNYVVNKLECKCPQGFIGNVELLAPIINVKVTVLGEELESVRL